MKLGTILAAAALLAAPAVAMAQPVDGLYVGAGVGYNLLQDQKVKSGGGGGSLKTDGGIVGLASVGYGFGNGLRAEIEGNFRDDDQKKGTAKATNQTYGGFVNGLFDFDVGTSVVYPYLGVGVGYVDQHYRNGTTAAPVVAFSGDKWTSAAQGIVGAAFPIPDATGLSITAEYRYMADFDSLRYGAVKTNTQGNHSFLIGLRYAFGVEAPVVAPPAPTPAPVAAPAPPPARTYLVFFDWDKADLSDRARGIIGEAASAVGKTQTTRIEVTGYTDNTGTPKYNLGLSVRRAQNVEAELVKDGVPANEINVQGLGESNPLVPTGPQTREPQNRRVQIVLK
jgi:outer membrane protein OmpA-like peptidoglycan-associated protein